jgi:hypothetical protein
VPNEVDVHDLSVLRKHRENVAFGEIERKPTGEHVRGMLILRVPRRAFAQTQTDLRDNDDDDGWWNVR